MSMVLMFASKAKVDAGGGFIHRVGDFPNAALDDNGKKVFYTAVYNSDSSGIETYRQNAGGKVVAEVSEMRQVEANGKPCNTDLNEEWGYAPNTQP